MDLYLRLATAEKYIPSGQYKRGIVIGSETLSKVIRLGRSTTAVFFGDGAGGGVYCFQRSANLLAESLFTDGARGEVLAVILCWSIFPLFR